MRGITRTRTQACTGEETYQALNHFLHRVFAEGSLSDKVTIAAPASDKADNGADIQLDVVWHLCGDIKFVMEVTGFLGCNSNKPCFMCLWDRRRGKQEAHARTDAEREYATMFLGLIPELSRAIADADLAAKTLKTAEDSGTCSDDYIEELQRQGTTRMQVQMQALNVRARYRADQLQCLNFSKCVCAVDNESGYHDLHW